MPAPQANDREFDFTQRDFQFISKLVHQRIGIVLKENKFDMVYSRMARRLRALNLRSVSDYLEFLQSDAGADEMGNMVNAITTNLTSFFREQHHFEHLAKNVLAPFASNKLESRLRIWSAGCSAGAEPYSIAMTLCETIPDYAKRDCKILATDIDTNMVQKGKNGIYDEDWVEKIPDHLRTKYVNGDQMGDKIKSLITFKPLNLLEGWPMAGKFDVIFCRNVVIYFDKETQKPLFNRYADILKPNGYLYIGHSENLNGVSDRFRLVGKTTYQKIK